MRSALTLLTLIVVWHISTIYNWIDPAFYPSPFKILNATFQLLSESDLLFNIYSSLKRLLLAFIIAAPLAIGLAMLASVSKKFDEILSPVIALTFPLPKVAVYPLMLLIFGMDETSKIALILIGLFYIIFINSRLGFKKLLISPANDVVFIYPLKKNDYIFQYMLKGSQLEILTGIKLALNYGLTLIVVSEATTSNNGIGYFIWRSWDQFKIINVYTGVFVLSFIGLVMYYSLDCVISIQRKKYF